MSEWIHLIYEVSYKLGSEACQNSAFWTKHNRISNYSQLSGVNVKAPGGRVRAPNEEARSEGGEDFTASTTTFQGQALIAPPMIQIRAVRD